MTGALDTYLADLAADAVRMFFKAVSRIAADDIAVKPVSLGGMLPDRGSLQAPARETLTNAHGRPDLDLTDDLRATARRTSALDPASQFTATDAPCRWSPRSPSG